MPDVVLVVQVADGLPEGARLPRRPLVSDRLPHEDEAPLWAGASGREQVAVAARLIGTDEPPAVSLVECATRVLVEERLDARPSREGSLLQTQDEHGVVAPRAGAQEVEDGDAAGRSRRGAPHGRPVEGGEHVPLAHLAARGDEGLQLMQRPGDRVVRLEIDERARVDRRRERPMGVSQQLVGQHPDDLHEQGRRRPRRRRSECSDRPAARP